MSYRAQDATYHSKFSAASAAMLNMCSQMPQLQAPALQHDSSNSLYPINSYENGIVLSDHFQRAFDRYAISFDMDVSHFFFGL